MIVKVATRKPGSKSSFARLAAYVSDAPRKGEKVLSQSVTNVTGLDWRDAVTEIRATQLLNQQTEVDKTYHLIVSFPTGERPTDTVLEDIEQTLVDAIGLSDHQRLSAVHDDTSHLHVHIVVNKVRRDGRVVTPYRDYRILNEAARDLELKHGLSVLEKTASSEQSQDGEGLSPRARDVEAHSKTQSFQRWAMDHIREPLRAVLNDSQAAWEDLHAVLSEHGLMIRPRGRGLIITDATSRFFVKPSQLSREFSKPRLEQRFGSFEAGPLPSKRCAYDVSPFPAESNHVLYQEYKTAREQALAVRRELFAGYQADKQRLYAAIHDEYQTRRTAAFNDTIMRYGEKREVLAKLRVRRYEEYATARELLAKQRDSIMDRTKLTTWVSFLVDRANDGDARALNLLRHRKPSVPPTGNCLVRRSGANPPFVDPGPDYVRQVHKNGDVSYRTDTEHLVVGEKTVHVNTMQPAAIAAAVAIAGHARIVGDQSFAAAVRDEQKRSGLER